ncbi:MAG: sulfotransferase [bacterium]
MKIKKQRIILVTGSNRSGTTWVGNILAATGQAKLVYEPFNIAYQKNKGNHPPFSNHFHFVLEKETPDVKQYIEKFLKSDNLSWIDDFKNKVSLKHFLGATYRYINRFLKSNNKIHILKDPIALFSAPWFYDVFNSSVVVLIRHPAAYVASIKRVNWRSNPKNILNQKEFVKKYLLPLKNEIQAFKPTQNNILEEATLRWKIYHFVIKSYMSEYPWIFIKHEDLCNDPVRQFRSLYSRLNLDFSQKTEEKISISSESNNDENTIDKKVHVLERDSKQLIKDWKNRLTNKEIEYVYESTKELSSCFYSKIDW